MAKTMIKKLPIITPNAMAEDISLPRNTAPVNNFIYAVDPYSRLKKVTHPNKFLLHDTK